MQRIWPLVLFLPFLAFSAQAQQAWTLQQCIEHALENNLQLRVNQLNVQLGEEALTLAEHARYPSLNGFATNNYNWGRSFDVFTNQPVTERVRSNNFGVSGNVTLFNGFRLTNTIKQRQIDLQSAEYDVEKAKNDMVLSLANAYLQILFNRENLDNANLQVASLSQQLERTKELVDAGVLPESNLLDLQSQQATNELQAVNAQNALAFSKLQLRQILQLTADTDFEVAVPTIPDPDVSDALDMPEAIYSTASTIMPEIKSADANVERNELGIDIAKTSYMPTISASFGINTFYSSAQREILKGYSGTVTEEIGFVVDPINNVTLPVLSFFPDRSNPIVGTFGFWDQLDESFRQSIGFTLSVPIYNRNQAKNSVAQARISAERANLNAQIVRNTLRQTIEQAYQDVIAARQTFQSNKKQVEALEETFRTTQERFNLGVTNITDFTVAQNNLNVAKANLIRAKYDYVFKRKILDFYMGREITLE